MAPTQAPRCTRTTSLALCVQTSEMRTRAVWCVVPTHIGEDPAIVLSFCKYFLKKCETFSRKRLFGPAMQRDEPHCGTPPARAFLQSFLLYQRITSGVAFSIRAPRSGMRPQCREKSGARALGTLLVREELDLCLARDSDVQEPQSGIIFKTTETTGWIAPCFLN